MSQGKKRASPGAEEEKNPFGAVELGDEEARKLEALNKEAARIELALERETHRRMAPLFEKRRAVLKAIDKFWPVALLNSPNIGVHAQHPKDQAALAYLEDVWVARNPAESRVFTLEFHFKPNPYFSDAVLKKEYKFQPPPAEETDVKDADGITDSQLEFSWERDVEPSSQDIQWKDEAHNLTRLYPQVPDPEDEELPAEAGSFFNYFTVAKDPYDLGVFIANELFPDAVEYFTGQAGDQIDSDEDDDEEDDSDEEEIDLEKPRVKKQKKA